MSVGRGQAVVFPGRLAGAYAEGAGGSYSSRRCASTTGAKSPHAASAVREHCSDDGGALQVLARRHDYAGASPEAQPGIGNLEVRGYPCSVTPCQSREGSSLLVEMRAEARRLDNAANVADCARRPGCRKDCMPAFRSSSPSPPKLVPTLAQTSTHHGRLINIARAEPAPSVNLIDTASRPVRRAHLSLPSAVLPPGA